MSATKKARKPAVDETSDGADGKLKVKDYEQELARLHVELVKLQQWVVHKGLKVCIVFEGRDGAGKGGTIKAITERVSPRVFRVVALAGADRARKVADVLPALYAALARRRRDRDLRPSWYNRAGVERVMGFCTEEQVKRFLMAAAGGEGDRRLRHHPAQILARSQRGGTDAPARSRASTMAARSGSCRRWT